MDCYGIKIWSNKWPLLALKGSGERNANVAISNFSRWLLRKSFVFSGILGLDGYDLNSKVKWFGL